MGSEPLSSDQAATLDPDAAIGATAPSQAEPTTTAVATAPAWSTDEFLPETPEDSDAGSSGTACEAEFASTELQDVLLAFAFDVSGSMGKLDEPHHDPELKWQPVVDATKAFFADGSSSGIQASLTFFPAEDDKCDAEQYLEPDVALTQLPSAAFAEAIDAISPEDEDDWRGGTPTLAVLRGTAQWLLEVRAGQPQAHHALVLVTDGYPQGCDDEEDDIEQVAMAVAEMANDLPTYVIGVNNPEGGPDTTSNLDLLAQAGKTEAAFLIATGKPAQTAAALRSAIEVIRGQTPSCEAPIPAHPAGGSFDDQKINVTLSEGGSSVQLGYDADCQAEDGWRFDDATLPSRIVLCAATCERVRSDAIELSVAFGCERINATPR